MKIQNLSYVNGTGSYNNKMNFQMVTKFKNCKSDADGCLWYNP